MATYTAKALQLPVNESGTISTKLIELKDAVAREATIGGTHYKGLTTTPLTDGASTNPIIISGASYTAVNGDMVVYSDGAGSDKEFLFASVDNKWHEYQDLSDTKELAYVDDAEGSYTPAGSLGGTTAFGVTLSSVTKYVAESENGGGSITASTGTVDSLTMAVDSTNESLEIGWAAGVPLGVTLPTFVEQTIVTGVSAVAQPDFAGTPDTITVAPAE